MGSRRVGPKTAKRTSAAKAMLKRRSPLSSADRAMVGSAKRSGTPKKKRSSADRAMVGSAKRSGSGTAKRKSVTSPEAKRKGLGSGTAKNAPRGGSVPRRKKPVAVPRKY